MLKNRKTAAVCYCLWADEMSSEHMSELLAWCQDVFEKAAFRELYQGFAVGRNIPFAVPMKTYPTGFRAVLDESDEKSVSLENLVLSYSILNSFMKQYVGRRDMEYYLVLLVADDMMYEDSNITSVLKKFSDLSERNGLRICCIGKNETVVYDKAFNMIDANGKNGIKALLSDV